MPRFKKCKMFATDCHGYMPWGYCKCLGDTDFGIKPCPFYKTAAQNEAENRAIKEGWPVPVSATKVRG